MQNALFSVNATTINDGTTIPYTTSFVNGQDISVMTSSSFGLATGHIYAVSYTFRTDSEVDGLIAVTPRFNTTNQPNFSSFSNTNSVETTTSVSGTFFADATLGAIELDFLYNGSATGTTPAGSVSIMEIQ